MKRKLQVFISSTFEDLKAERQAAVAAVLKAGHIPAGMELFTAGDKSQMAVIEKWIDQSDVYMLILGGRYGSVEPTTNVSYTELEYDYAVQQGKRLFAVVIDKTYLEEKVKVHGTKFIETINAKELELFRNKVLSNMSSFFKDDKDIKLCVHESLSDLSDDTSLVGWVSASEIIDAQIMQDEIRRLTDENSKLSKELAQRKDLNQNPQNNLISTIDDMMATLQSTKIKVPGDLTSDKKEFTNSLLDIFVANYESFVAGVTNRAVASDAETFMFSNIAPKLQIHGLIKIDRVPNAQYRIATTTLKGDNFLAEVQRRIAQSKQKKAKDSEAV